MSEPHATEPQRRHLDTAFAKHTLLHVCYVCPPCSATESVFIVRRRNGGARRILGMLVCTARIAGAAALLCALLSSPEKARGSSRKVLTDGLSRPSFRFHATCSFAGSRKVSTRRVAKNLPTRASNILCGVRQLCQVKLSQRQMCQVELSHAVSQTSPCCEKRQFNLAHLSHSESHPATACAGCRGSARDPHR